MEKIYVPLQDVVRNAIITLDGKDKLKLYVTLIDGEEYIDIDTMVGLISDLDYALGYAHEEIHDLKNMSETEWKD